MCSAQHYFSLLSWSKGKNKICTFSCQLFHLHWESVYVLLDQGRDTTPIQSWTELCSQKSSVNSSELMHCCQMILAISSSEVQSEPCHSHPLVILQMQMCLREAKFRAFCVEESTVSCDTQLLECCHKAR